MALVGRDRIICGMQSKGQHLEPSVPVYEGLGNKSSNASYPLAVAVVQC